MQSVQTTHLEFRWTVSRGRDTYGYNICTLYADGKRVARCNGGGYDMEGTCLGSWLETHYADRLRELKPDDMPPQSHWERANPLPKVCRNVACVLSVIETGKELEDFPSDAEVCPHCGTELDTNYNAGRSIDDGRYFYGLRFYDPTYNPEKAVLEHADGVFTKEEDVGKTFGQLRQEGKLVNLDVMRAAYKATSPHATERHTRPEIDGACGMSSVKSIAEAIGLRLEYVNVRSKKSTIYVVHDSRI